MSAQSVGLPSIAAAVRGRLEARVINSEGRYQFHLTGPGGGDLTVTLRGGRATVSEGTHGAADCEVTMTLQDAAGLLHGSLSAIQAFFSGRFAITGDMAAAMRLGRLLER